MQNKMLDAALAYAAAGFKVFPLRTKEKVPATPNGLKDASADPVRIRNWWTFKPDYNIGIVTGDGLTVVDVDTDKLTPESSDFVSSLPDTFTVTTGRGLHLYYAGDMPNTAGRLPGVDTRGTGGYVVAPPSVHPNGSVYASEGLPSALTPLPPYVPLALTKSAAPRTSDNVTIEEVHEGGRNQYLARAAGQMQRAGILTLQAILALNEEKCNPPLDEGEVTAIYNSISRYAPAAPIAPDSAPNRWIIKANSLTTQTIEGISDKEKVKGLSTGFDALDALLGGGYRLGEFVALSASAKTGKSSFLASLIHNLVGRGIPVGYASREMDPASEVLPNMLSMEHKLNAWTTDVGADLAAKYAESIDKWPLYFTPGYGYMPIEELRDWVKALVSIGVHYFFLDHLHYALLDPEDYKAAVKLAQEIKTLTKEFNVCFWSVIQPGKLMEGQRLGFNQMRGGAGVAQALDSVLILDRHRGPDGREVHGISRLTLDIARHKLARPGAIFLEYDFDTTEFHHVEARRVEDPVPPVYD